MNNQKKKKPQDLDSIVGQIASFLLIGTAATAVQMILYFLLSNLTVVYLATGTSLVLSTLFSTSLNRQFTFAQQAKQSSTSNLSLQVQGIALMILTAIAQSLAGGLAQELGLNKAAESILVAGAGAAIGGIRFLIMKFWIFSSKKEESPGLLRPDQPANPANCLWVKSDDCLSVNHQLPLAQSRFPVFYLPRSSGSLFIEPVGGRH